MKRNTGGGTGQKGEIRVQLWTDGRPALGSGSVQWVSGQVDKGWTLRHDREGDPVVRDLEGVGRESRAVGVRQHW